MEIELLILYFLSVYSPAFLYFYQKACSEGDRTE